MNDPAKALIDQRMAARRARVTRAEASLSRLADQREDDLAEVAQDLGIEALAAWTAYTLATTPSQMAAATKRGRAVVAKRKQLLERVK